MDTNRCVNDPSLFFRSVVLGQGYSQYTKIREKGAYMFNKHFLLNFISVVLQPFTFQCVIASDRINTYVIYNYIDMNRVSDYLWYYVSIGYRSGPFNSDLTLNLYYDKYIQRWSRSLYRNLFKLGVLPGNMPGEFDKL